MQSGIFEHGGNRSSADVQHGQGLLNTSRPCCDATWDQLSKLSFARPQPIVSDVSWRVALLPARHSPRAWSVRSREIMEKLHPLSDGCRWSPTRPAVTPASPVTASRCPSGGGLQAPAPLKSTSNELDFPHFRQRGTVCRSTGRGGRGGFRRGLGWAGTSMKSAATTTRGGRRRARR